jgi:indolepyruvate ferredoxin oxidoreductase
MSLDVIPARSLAARYTAHDQSVLLTGVQALVRLVLEQQRVDQARGHKSAAFISGYEGSPLGGLDLELARRRKLLDELGVVHQPAVNEELAATSVFGTQLVPDRADARHDGVVGYWYGKAPGLDRATDAIRHANFGGTHPAGGAVALVGDDPSCKSSSVPSASEIALAELAIPTFFPADSQEVLEYGLHAVALSRATGLWGALKIVTNVADGASPVVIPEHWDLPILPDPLPGEEPYRHRPTSKLIGAGAVECETTAYGVRMDLARAYARLNGLNVLEGHGARDRIGIVASGKTYLDVVEALRTLGLDEQARERHGIRLLKLGLLFPVEPTILREFAAGLDQVVVVEEKRPFLETAIRDLLYGGADVPSIVGKRDADRSPLIPQDGELTPDRIVAPLARRLRLYADVPAVHAAAAPARAARALPVLQGPPLPARTPYFCSGCPHSRSTQVPDGSLVGAGIGCSSMVLFMDSERVGDVIGLTQMGGEGAQWIGMAAFVETSHMLQNTGEGTFHHSGSLALRASVAAKTNITYKLLYNSAVAMTGGQRAVGLRSVEELTHMLHAEGVARTIVTVEDPRRYRGVRLASATEVWRRERLKEAQSVLAATPGVTVLIHDQQCATEKRRDRKRNPSTQPETRVVINERVCEGCGDCGRKSNCLSVEPVDTDLGRKTRIHQGSCNTDLACLDGDCPSFVTVVPGKRRPAATAPAAAPLLPEPTVVVGPDEVAVRITGIGGTGVVTVAQIVAQAAHLSGWQVRTLDQTGLSQKAGPVISDLKLSRTAEPRASKLGEGECDLYLGCDLLVAADDKHLAVASTERTVAVVSLGRTPTGHMVVDPDAVFPDVDGVAARIRSVARADAGCAIDARHLAETECGGDQYANVVMLGAAYQTGALALPLSALEEAIRLNGVAVDANLQAFAVGRAAALGHGPAPEDRRPPQPRPAVADLIARVRAEPGSELARVVADRTTDLVAYQSVAYARTYAETVERVRAAEATAAPGEATLAEAVARNLYKLMAYKDEYEVARLSLDPALRAQIREQFGTDARFAWRFHPPVLRALGLRRKVSLGRWATPLLATLRAGRRLRGTPLDVFGLAEVRRMERRLVAEYREVVDELLTRLRPGNHALAVEIAGLPDLIRGYEDIKLDNVVRYHERLRERRAALTVADSVTV